MIRTQIQLTEEQAVQLKAKAAREGRSIADVVRDGVAAVVSEPGAPARVELKRRALAAVGRFRSGRRDVSASHDRYLAKAYR